MVGFLTALPDFFGGAIALPSMLSALAIPCSFGVKIAITCAPLTPLGVITINCATKTIVKWLLSATWQRVTKGEGGGISGALEPCHFCCGDRSPKPFSSWSPDKNDDWLNWALEPQCSVLEHWLSLAWGTGPLNTLWDSEEKNLNVPITSRNNKTDNRYRAWNSTVYVSFVRLKVQHSARKFCST